MTPAYQLITHLLTPPSTPTTNPSTSSTSLIPKLTLIYASPTPSEILLKSELKALASLSSPISPLSIKYLVSSPSDSTDKPGWLDFAGLKKRKEEMKELEMQGVTVGRIGRGNLEEWIGRGDSTSLDGKKRIVIVCGPEGCVLTSSPCFSCLFMRN